jgi:hypothetical protein
MGRSIPPVNTITYTVRDVRLLKHVLSYICCTRISSQRILVSLNRRVHRDNELLVRTRGSKHLLGVLTVVNTWRCLLPVLCTPWSRVLL